MTKLRSERDGRVLTITLDNPPLNFLTTPIMDELHALLRSAEKDRSIGAIILTSAVEGIFVFHFDVREFLAAAGAFGDLPVSPALAAGVLRTEEALERIPGARAAINRTPAAGIAALRRYHEVCGLLNRLDKVVIAAINGTAMGGGSELALACDIRLMADGEFEIGQPEICVGLIPGGGGTQRLPLVVGHARALELMLEGRPLYPREAQEIGYVHRVVAPDQLMAEARATAARLARRSPVAVAAIKRAVYTGAALEHGLHTERAGFVTAVADPATRRALRAYLDFLDQLEQSGEAFSVKSFQAWLDGTAADFTG